MIKLNNICLAFGAHPLLDGLELSINSGERVALVGRNGTGKSTLLRIIAGEIIPEDGHIEAKPGSRIARLEQEAPLGLSGSVYDVVAAGLGDVGAKLAHYHDLAHRMGQGEDVTEAFSRAQQALESADGWNLSQQVDTTISRLQLPVDARFEALSGGQQRRVLLGRALVQKPDLLLLDEPTNHLDISAITQLEEIMLGFGGALLFITHDRAFLRRLATRIIDLDRGKLTSWPGDYASYLEGKNKALEDEEKANALFDKRLAQEEIWIRQGIKARRTRNEGRVRALKKLRTERSQRRERQGVAKLTTQDAERSGKRVVVAENVSYAWGEKPIVCNFSTVIQRGDKVGIIGPNGCGKSTLIGLLLGKLAPQTGTVNLGSSLQIAHFDQLRSALDLNATVLDNVGQGRTSIEVNGQSKHVMSYLQDFLFTPQRVRSPAKVLSGGERNRLLLAKLFTQPANLLVMDEPTNDLDVETLELLEDRLIDYQGTLLLVSHDRAFIDNVVTSTLVFEGNGRIGEYVGGYADWLRQKPAAAPTPSQSKPAAARKSAPKAPGKQNILNNEQRKQLRQLPKTIESLEAKINELEQRFGEPALLNGSQADIAAASKQLSDLQAELETAFGRWEQLEAMQSA